MKDKLEKFAETINKQKTEIMIRKGFTYDFSNDVKVHIRPGRKYTKIDVGSSGTFMVDNKEGIIFGIKGYGVVHKGKSYGTLDTTDDYFWGEYAPIKKSV